jgi:hypothetical protein
MSRVDRSAERHQIRTTTGAARERSLDHLVDQLTAAAPDLTDDQVARIAVTVADRPVPLGRRAASALRIGWTPVGGTSVGAATTVLWCGGFPGGALALGFLVLFLMWLLDDDDRTNRARALIYPSHGPVGDAAQQTRSTRATWNRWWRAIRR